MSNPNAPVFPHGDLMVVASWFLRSVLATDGYIVGSLRRCPECAARGIPKHRAAPRCAFTTKDIDLLAPMGGATDGVYTRLQRVVDLHDQAVQPMLIQGERTSFCTIVKGMKPGFREVSFILDLFRAETNRPDFPREIMSDLWWKQAGMHLLPVQIFRYDPGAEGNLGWIQLIRTGPNRQDDPWGQACLARWKDVSGGGKSEGGYPHDKEGRRIAVPTEEAAFAMLNMPFIPPHQRTAKRVPGWGR